MPVDPLISEARRVQSTVGLFDLLGIARTVAFQALPLVRPAVMLLIWLKPEVSVVFLISRSEIREQCLLN